MSAGIIPVVEGKGEVAAVPVLLRRILHDMMQVFDVPIIKPWRVGRRRVVRPGKLEETVEFMLRKRSGVGAVLVLLDADDDCPAELGPRLVSRARRATGKPVSAVLANREFEAWFLGAIDSLGGGFSRHARTDLMPERVRGAKEGVVALLGSYDPVKDQAALAEKMDLYLCRQHCRSFDKLVRDIEWLVQTIR